MCEEAGMGCCCWNCQCAGFRIPEAKLKACGVNGREGDRSRGGHRNTGRLCCGSHLLEALLVREGLLFALLCSLLKNQRGLLVHCVYKFHCPQHEVEPRIGNHF